MVNNVNEFVKILINNDVLDHEPKNSDISKMFNELYEKGLITAKELNEVEKQVYY